jgi:hypothetical protein
MDLLISWLVFPLVLLVLASGCGLLLESVIGTRLNGALVPTLGFAVVLVAGNFTTATNATAELTVPLVIALAVAGFALSPPWQRLPLDGWAVAAGAGALVAFGLPVLLSGDATFTGYIKLDDTSTWLSFTDRVMEHGRSINGLAPSTYEATLAVNLGRGYPWGAFPPLGIGGLLTGKDVVWLFQPYLAFMGAMLALALYALTSALIESRPLRALASVVSAQAALLFAYSLWGGIKEVAAAWILALAAAVAVQVLRALPEDSDEPAPIADLARNLLPLAIASAAMLAVLSLGGAVWLAPLLFPTVALLFYLRGRVFALRAAATFCVVGAAAALPSLLTAQSFLKPYGDDLKTQPLGNLIEPLSPFQTMGIWPAGDFRLHPAESGPADVLIAVALAAALLGIVWAYRTRSWETLLYAIGAIGSAVLVGLVATPWVDAKAFAIASPALVLVAMVGAGAVMSRGRLVEAAVLAVAISGGVLWSNVLAYHEVTLAPHERFSELDQIGDRIKGEGPALMTEYEPYGVRHFLRDADTEGASELRRRQIPLRTGRILDKAEFADIDEFNIGAIFVYRTLVLRRSPVASRPPSPYRLTWSGRYYEVWQLQEQTQTVLEHLPLGDRLDPVATPDCADVVRLARLAGSNGMLATVRRPEPLVFSLARIAHDPAWPPDPSTSEAVLPGEAGSAQVTVRVTRPGRYELWLGGAFRRHVEILIDGRVVASARHVLSHNSQYEPMGEIELAGGPHRVEIRNAGADWHPGSGGPAFPLGPLALSLGTADQPVSTVSPSRATSLCGRQLDWIEAIGNPR